MPKRLASSLPEMPATKAALRISICLGVSLRCICGSISNNLSTRKLEAALADALDLLAVEQHLDDFIDLAIGDTK